MTKSIFIPLTLSGSGRSTPWPRTPTRSKSRDQAPWLKWTSFASASPKGGTRGYQRVLKVGQGEPQACLVLTASPKASTRARELGPLICVPHPRCQAQGPPAAVLKHALHPHFETKEKVKTFIKRLYNTFDKKDWTYS